MASLTLTLFGMPEVVVDGTVQTTFHSVKSRALLYYLAVTERPHARIALATLLWEGLPASNALSNLRKALTDLRKVVGDHLEISRESVTFVYSDNVTVDVCRFMVLLSAENPTLSQLESTINLWRGDFLEGFSVRDSAEFEAWLQQQRRDLFSHLQSALFACAEMYEERGDLPKAIETARHLINLNPLDEEAQRLLMLLYAQAGSHERAVAQFGQLETLLSAELDQQPSAPTQRLHEKIAAREIGKTTDIIHNRQSSQRSILRDKVRRYWIDGVLQEACRPATPIKRNWQFVPTLIERPWADFERASPPFTHGTATDLRQTFNDSDGALLIAGAAGVGKTITLLTLADELLLDSADDPTAPIPIVLLLSTWANKKQPLDQWIVAELTARYQIPRQLGQRWLTENRLVLLLDGLDEVPRTEQTHCIAAINRLRATHGLTKLAVCCRTAVLADLPTKLHLNTAIALEPLTLAQAERYLAQSDPNLRTAIRQQAWLQEMVQSPLLLNLLAIVWQEDNVDGLSREGLFGRFVTRSFAQWSGDSTTAQHHTHWLATQLTAHNQTACYLDTLQPSWLEKRRSRLLYLLLTRLIIVGLLGIAMALLYRVGTLDQPQFRLELFAIAGRWLPFDPLWQETVGFMLLAQMHWLFAFGIDAWWYERVTTRFTRRRAILLIALHAVASLGYIVAVALPFQSATISFFSGVLLVYFIVVALGYWQHAQSYRNDIRFAASLGWSWRGAGIGALFGVLLGAIFTALGNPIHYMLLTIAPAIVTGGLRRLRLERGFRPNQSIIATARNALLGGAAQGAIPLVLFGWFSPLEFTVITSLVAAGIGALLFGGATLIKHAILRLLLYFESGLPLNLAQFLDQLTAVGLLRRIGGGYIFFHQLLQDYCRGGEQ